MKIFRLAAAILIGAGFIGCDNGDANRLKTGKTSGDAHDHTHSHDGHDHSHDGHSHSTDSHDHKAVGHAHAAGPHGGTVIDWGGGKYHVEFVVDHEKKQATAYIFGSDEKTPVAIGSENVELSIVEPAFHVTLMPQSQESDPAGAASRFAGSHENLAENRKYSGTLTALIDGTPYSGDFKE